MSKIIRKSTNSKEFLSFGRTLFVNNLIPVAHNAVSRQKCLGVAERESDPSLACNVEQCFILLANQRDISWEVK